MTTGMLWLLDGRKPIVDALREGLAYFEKKYGHAPKACHVNPEIDSVKEIDRVKVEMDAAVLRGHVWIGLPK